MRSYFAEVQNIKEDGTYLITPDGIEDYAAKWGYGAIVGLRPLVHTDLKDWTLFGIWTNDKGEVEYDLVRHVASYADAVKLAHDFDQVAYYDLFAREVVYL